MVLLSCVLCLMFTGFLLVNAKPSTANADDAAFYMEDGASMRLQNTEDNKYNGVTFSAIIDAGTYEACGGECYMIIMTKDYATRGVDITSAASYVWEYDGAAAVTTAPGYSSAKFLLGYDKNPVSGKVRVLHIKCSAVPLASEDPLDFADPEDAVYYQLRASVVNLNAKNLATQYIGQCYCVNGEDKVFATQASESGRYRSPLDVSLRAKHSGNYAAYADRFAEFETEYTKAYKKEHGEESTPTYSYKIKYYYNSFSSTPVEETVSGQALDATISIDTSDNKASATGQDADTIYTDSGADTGCDSVTTWSGNTLSGYLLPDDDVVIKVLYRDKTHTTKAGVIDIEEYNQSQTIDASVLNVYKVKIKTLDGSSTVTYTDGNSKSFDAGRVGINAYTYYFDEIYDNVNHKIYTYIPDDTHATYKRCAFQHTNYNTQYTLEIYGDTKYVTATVRPVTMIINNMTELRDGFYSQSYAVKFYDSTKTGVSYQSAPETSGFDFGFWQWGGYFELGNDIDCKNANMGGNTYGYYWGDQNASGYGYLGRYALYADDVTSWSATSTAASNKLPVGFVGTFDGKGYCISNYRIYSSADTRTAANALFGMIGKSGEVKNIMFNGVTRNGEGGIVCFALCGGTLKNIYVTGVNLTYSSGVVSVREGVIVSRRIAKCSTLQQCVVEVNCSTFSGTNSFAFGVAESNMEHCYVVGTGSDTDTKNYITENSSGNITREHLKTLADYCSMFKLNMGEESVTFDTEFWAQDNGYKVPYPKDRSEYNLTFETITCNSPDKGPIDTTDITGGSLNGASYQRASFTATRPFGDDTIAYISNFDWYYASGGTSYATLEKGDDYYYTVTSGTVYYKRAKFRNTDYDGSSREIVFGSLSERNYVKHRTIIATAVILTAMDLHNFAALAKQANSSKPYLWSGTFIVGRDIKFGYGGYNWNGGWGYRNIDTFGYYAMMVDIRDNQGGFPAGTGGWNDNQKMGFNGTFDGHGFNLEGVAIPQSTGTYSDGALTYHGGLANGFIGILNKDGVLKNVSFTHAFSSWQVGFLTCSCGGTIQDVYVHMDRQGGGETNNKSAVIASQTRAASVVNGVATYSTYINRVHFIVDHVVESNIYTTPIGEFYDNVVTSHGNDMIKNCSGYGNTNARFNSDDSYDNKGISYLGSGGGSKKINAAATIDRVSLYQENKNLINNCVTENDVFWKKVFKRIDASTAIYYLTTNNLDGRDLPIEQDEYMQSELGYWNSSDPTNYNIYITEAGNSNQYIGTIRFTRETLPVGSVIDLSSGYRYRPEGWLTEAQQASRPAIVTTAGALIITDAWWGDYIYRAFHIYKDGAPALDDDDGTKLAGVLRSFKIYRPSAW